METFKKTIRAVIDEISDVFKMFLRNILGLINQFWKQNWSKKLIDLAIAVIFISHFQIVGMMIFNISMGFGMYDLSIPQTIIYGILCAGVCSFVFFNFAELFIILSLGGISIFSQELYTSIKLRMETYENCC